ncbi:MurR/RpiR family transcriptional regulator [uncultured Sphaerochaeta sp.]|uniref:MurR/RpiR family transcriptional regulator n=1 Tax=uncultured Sphaerochaeta sp. TaxID=886478 RepID=UPI002A0A8800|nr:MurR/RpiR family transcriptional regulator [uncultured Sphaerochaeta sp.]
MSEQMPVLKTPQWKIRLETAIKQMGAVERRVAEYILEDPKRIISKSITEVAEEAGASEATIVRFCRHIGCVGFQDLKISVAQEVVPLIDVMYSGISPEDSIGTIKSKVFYNSIRSMQDSQVLLDDEQLEKAVKLLANAKQIDIVGMGSSGIVAEDAQHKFLKIGLNVNVFRDTHLQMLSISRMQEGDVVIGISFTGGSRDVIDALEYAQAHKIHTIGITSQPKSPLTKASDIKLFSTGHDSMLISDNVVSRMATLALIDTLYVAIGLQMGDKALNNLEKGRESQVIKGF